MIKKFRIEAIEHLVDLGVSNVVAEGVVLITMVMITLLLGYLMGKLVRFILLRAFHRFTLKTRTDWDDLLIEKKVFSALSYLVPTYFTFYVVLRVFKDYEELYGFMQKSFKIALLVLVLIIIFRMMNVLQVIIGRAKAFKDRPIESFFQLIKIIIGVLMGILMLSIMADKSVMYFVTAFGAMTAVLLLVFRDTILGFIASIQLSANEMVKIGDWVQMDKYGADGNVIQLNLTTVKVRNWDKTITTVPTYSFISDSFKNWRGMEEVGARRIARALYIDQHAIRFCTPEMVERFKKIHILKDYINGKEEEIKRYNEENNIDTSAVSNGRRLTNLGTFRAYLLKYLKSHPKIKQDMTILVRQMPPTENGIPIQIYAFCNDIAWANYEDVQSDIFDHALSVVEQFDLKIFQSPSGANFQTLTGSLSKE